MPADKLQTATRSTEPGTEMRTGGAVLLIGAVIFLVTVGFELIIGWPPAGGEATDITAFMVQHWSTLQAIWAVQMLGVLLIASSALVLLQSRRLTGMWRPASVIWSMVAVAGTVLTVAYGFALGSYPALLPSVEENPGVFAAVRGGVRFLLNTALAVALLGFSLVFIREGLATDGIVPRSWIVGIAVAVVFAILAAAFGLLQPVVASAVIFFVPMLLGLALWRAGRQLAP